MAVITAATGTLRLQSHWCLRAWGKGPVLGHSAGAQLLSHVSVSLWVAHSVISGSSVHRISQARILECVDISFSRRHTHIDTMRPGFLDRRTSCGLSWVSECRRKTPQCLLETSTLQISCDSRGLPTGSLFSQGKSGLKRSELRGQRETPVASPSLVSEVVGGGQSAEVRAEGPSPHFLGLSFPRGNWVMA